MAKSKKKTLKLTTYIVLALLVILAILLFFNGKMPSEQKSLDVANNNERTLETKEPKYSTGYTVNRVDDDWALLESKSLGFKIDIPNNSGVQEFGGYDEYVNPKNKTSGLGIDTSSSKHNTDMVLWFTVGDNLSTSTKQYLQTYISKYSSNWNTKYEDIKQSEVGNTKGYETRNINDLSGNYIYVTEANGKYVIIQYAFPFHNTGLSGSEQWLADKILSTFELLN